MNINLSKKEKIIIISYLVVIFIIGLGITYSFFMLADRAQKDSTKVYAGKLEVKYTQGNDVITNTLYPIQEPSFEETKQVYKTSFTVSSEGTLEQNVSINFQVAKNEFTNNTIKFALYSDSGNKISTGFLNEGLVILADNLYFDKIETRKYVLIIWLQESPDDQSTEQGNKLSGRIVISSKQYGY